MALQATHIRFALDLIDVYKVSDIKSFVAGAVYPDSRYFTGIKRELTHPPDFLSWVLEDISDYQKGQHSHLLCDNLQASIASEKFLDIFQGRTIEQGDDLWVSMTAIKVAQDFSDQSKFNLKSNLPDLSLVQSLNGEDEKILLNYFNLIINTYEKSSPFTLSNYHELLGRLGLSGDSYDKLIETSKEFSSNPVKFSVIESIYPTMILEAKNILKTNERSTNY